MTSCLLLHFINSILGKSVVIICRMQNKCCKIVQKCVFMRRCDPYNLQVYSVLSYFSVVLSTLLSVFVWLKLIKTFSH